MSVPPLAYFCTRALANLTDSLIIDQTIQCPLTDLLDQHDELDPCLWATIAQLVHPLPHHFHDIDIPLSHPHLPRLQRISNTHNFSLITLLALPNCNHVRDDNITQIASLNRLVALDLRGTHISAYALTVLARALNPHTRTGIWGLRLLSLHSCPSINNDALAVLQNFPLLSAIDLRFTKCSPSLVRAQLGPLGFRPSQNKSLFHPAPLFLALCTLENIANSASPPISLYSCPLHSVFRIHIDALHQPSSRSKPTAREYPPTTSTHPTIRTTSFAEDIGTVTFLQPVRKAAPPSSTRVTRRNTVSSASGQPISVDDPISVNPDSSGARNYSLQRRPRWGSSSYPRDNEIDTQLVPREDSQTETRVLPSSSYPTPVGPTDLIPSVQSTRQVTQPELFCDVSSFYKSAHSNRSRNGILPLSAQAVQSLEDSRLEPLAVARSPPPWSVPEPYEPKSRFNNSRKTQPVFGWSTWSLDEPVKVDRARLHKRSSTAVADMVNKFANKRPKVESEFARVKAQERLPAKSRNPFTKSAKSVFAETGASTSDQPRCSAQGSSSEAEPQMHTQACGSKSQEDNGLTKPLKPITTLKPPILPKELLPPPSKPPQPKAELKQTLLPFTRDGLDLTIDIK